MSDPKETKTTQETKPQEESEKTSTHFLVADRELRPEGTHFEAEGGQGYAQKWLTAMAGDAARPTASAN